MNFLCLEFANSSWYITHKLFKDPLSDAQWLTSLAMNRGMKQLPKPTEAEIAAMIEMRGWLSTLLRKQIDGIALSKQDNTLLNDYMRNTLYYRQLLDCNGSFRLDEVSDSNGWRLFMSEVAASFARLYASEDAAKLKLCGNPECGWFFIDSSKSGTKKWCDDTCASRMKVRRFRQKQKQEKGSPQ